MHIFLAFLLTALAAMVVYYVWRCVMRRRKPKLIQTTVPVDRWDEPESYKPAADEVDPEEDLATVADFLEFHPVVVARIVRGKQMVEEYLDDAWAITPLGDKLSIYLEAGKRELDRDTTCIYEYATRAVDEYGSLHHELKTGIYALQFPIGNDHYIRIFFKAGNFLKAYEAALQLSFPDLSHITRMHLNKSSLRDTLVETFPDAKSRLMPPSAEEMLSTSCAIIAHFTGTRVEGNNDIVIAPDTIYVSSVDLDMELMYTHGDKVRRIDIGTTVPMGRVLAHMPEGHFFTTGEGDDTVYILTVNHVESLDQTVLLFNDRHADKAVDVMIKHRKMLDLKYPAKWSTRYREVIKKHFNV